MKRIVKAIALFVAATFITAGVWAQDHKMKATVPFNFTVNGNSLPSGTYTIRSDSSNPNLLLISNREKSVHILTMAKNNDPGKGNALIFHKYGDQYFLSQICSDLSAMNLSFSVSKAEKRAREQMQVSQRPVSSDVTIALK
ncbi:hypothetical protein [Edaphobacter aggregans]|uniref:hypothetical protein n=1 Tax=Edaphobacter aggregans TaxID=570835 RepID=UPI0005544604|nr:hypothetical protein [Edaphobacter aggregans]